MIYYLILLTVLFISFVAFVFRQLDDIREEFKIVWKNDENFWSTYLHGIKLVDDNFKIIDDWALKTNTKLDLKEGPK